MARINLKYRITDSGNFCLSEEDFRKFGPGLLDMGDISTGGQTAEALISIFDLAGFTSFCNQRDPHLTVPEFLDKFLRWLFYEILELLDDGSRSLEERCFEARLPNFVKFMGDGVLLIWELGDGNSRDLNHIDNRKIIEALRQVCQAYHWDFLNRIENQFHNAPDCLRCSIVQGQLVSLGQGKEYVGQCINLASRLVKQIRLSFVISQKGIKLERHMYCGNPNEAIVKKKLKIDGIGTEIVYILKKEFDALPEKQKIKFKDISTIK